MSHPFQSFDFPIRFQQQRLQERVTPRSPLQS